MKLFIDPIEQWELGNSIACGTKHLPITRSQEYYGILVMLLRRNRCL